MVVPSLMIQTFSFLSQFSLCGISELTTEHGILRNVCDMDCVTKFLRHHITHWASCFRAFGMNSEDQTGTYSPSIPPLAIRNARIDTNNRNTDDTISRKFSRSRRTNKGTIPTPKRVSNKIRTSFAEKDFIVFSIKEDGTFDIAKDGSSQMSVCQDDHGLRSLRSVSIKLKSRGEQEASVKGCNEETSTGGSPVLIPDDEDDKEESMCLGEDSHSGSAGMGFQMEGNGDCTRASTESRDSGQSDGSTDSFTFPVLHGQWIGSPVKMPRSEDLSLRKPTASCVRFKCCKF